MDKFYVYMYLRGKRSVNGEAGMPYYVGKGHGRRAFCKHGNVPLPKDRSRIVVLLDGLSEQMANAEEKRLIAEYGRIDKKTGCLRNRTDGGEGQCGVIVSEVRRAAFIARMKGHKYNLGRKQTPEEIATRSAALRGKKKRHRDPEHTEKIRQKQIGKVQSQETKDRRAAKLRGRKRGPMSEEQRLKISLTKLSRPTPIGVGRKVGSEPWNKGTKGVMKPNRTSYCPGFTPWSAGKKAQA